MIIPAQESHALNCCKTRRLYGCHLMFKGQGRIKMDESIIRNPVSDPPAGALCKGQILDFLKNDNIITFQINTAWLQAMTDFLK